MSKWSTILSAEELAANRELTAKIDPRFAREQHKFYSSQSVAQLRSLKSGAWYANDSEGYQMAASYLALLGA